MRMMLAVLSCVLSVCTCTGTGFGQTSAEAVKINSVDVFFARILPGTVQAFERVTSDEQWQKLLEKGAFKEPPSPWGLPESMKKGMPVESALAYEKVSKDAWEKANGRKIMPLQEKLKVDFSKNMAIVISSENGYQIENIYEDTDAIKVYVRVMGVQIVNMKPLRKEDFMAAPSPSDAQAEVIVLPRSKKKLVMLEGGSMKSGTFETYTKVKEFAPLSK